MEHPVRQATICGWGLAWAAARRGGISETGGIGVGGARHWIGYRPIRGAAEPRTLTVAWDTDIDTLDPASFKSIGAYTVQANIYDSPLMWKVDPVAGSPGLYPLEAGGIRWQRRRAWSFEDNGATLVMQIRKGMTFPSGRPVNAAAVKYMLDRSLQSPGYMRLVLPLLLRVTKPEQFELRDDETVAIHMPRQAPSHWTRWRWQTTHCWIPRKSSSTRRAGRSWATAWLKRNTAGLGPYQLTKNEPGVGVVLEATKPVLAACAVLRPHRPQVRRRTNPTGCCC